MGIETFPYSKLMRSGSSDELYKERKNYKELQKILKKMHLGY
jgi:hypothetical protein